jgi:hypothetical protein
MNPGAPDRISSLGFPTPATSLALFHMQNPVEMHDMPTIESSQPSRNLLLALRISELLVRSSSTKSVVFRCKRPGTYENAINLVFAINKQPLFAHAFAPTGKTWFREANSTHFAGVPACRIPVRCGQSALKVTFHSAASTCLQRDYHQSDLRA